MSMTSESEEMMMPNNSVDSPPIDDANSGGGIVGGNGPLKKGPWTSAEDAILVDYVTKHGEGNWNAVQRQTGLARCGKSCRLRWANHLRPDLKKGAFTVEEERRIIELHAKMGNKWARMAAELPGRTDNEIKNYWNTRIKRRQRAGLPIYPADICLQQMNGSQQGDDIITFSSSADLRHPDFMQPVHRFDIPDVEFKNLELNQQLYPPPPPLHDIPSGSLLDIPASSLLAHGLHSTTYPNNKPFISTIHPPPKRLRGSETLFPNFNPNMGNASFQCQQNDGSMQIGQSFLFSSGYDYHQNSTSEIHAGLNGNNKAASSEPSWAMKLDLPSFQTQMGGWGSSSPSPSSPLPFFEPVDILIQTPPTENTQSCNLSPRNSGLLDAVLYESETKKNSKSNGGCENSRASNLMDNNDNDNNNYDNNNYNNSTHDHLHETEWEAYDERLSLGHSSSSVLSESTPISGNSLDEHHSADSLPGCKVKEAASNLGEMQYDDKVETANQLIMSRPDFLLAANCFGSVENYQGPFFDERCNRNLSW